MESVVSCQDRSDAYYPLGGYLDDFGQDDLGRPLVAATETAHSAGLTAPRIPMSAIADLKKFNERGMDEVRSRIWIRKVMYALLRDQDPYEEKCL